MFESYLEDGLVYLSLERYFLSYFYSSLNFLGVDKSDFLVPLYRTAFANGQPFQDGNPIFSAKNKVSGDSLRVVISDDVVDVVSYGEAKSDGEELVVVGNVKKLSEIEVLVFDWIAGR
ncbi:hypothetical protein [Pseudomonas laurentiana]|uniref:hypothetical protein n=1 Tax=Pseudomonas laurentiana TaxID=2364649 RepID=UPI0016788334|nr:hypothetical protein [Pseudomonas laurentiana]